MGARENVAGQRFGRLVAISRLEPRNKRTFWSFRCDCGIVKPINLPHVKQGKIQSCGCLLFEVLHSPEHAAMCARAAKLPRSHGMSRTPVHAVWKSMKQRCQNPKCKDYKHYGALGVRVCERWQKFENFYADMGEPKGLTLERKDPRGNYEPGNCKWATWLEQQNNQRRHSAESYHSS